MGIQISLGSVLAARAYRCWDLTSGVPDEYEAGLWEEGDQAMLAAALFGHEEAERWRREEEARKADRSADQQCFWKLAHGFI